MSLIQFWRRKYKFLSLTRQYQRNIKEMGATCELKNLTKEQSDEIQKYYMEHYGKKIKLDCHRYYYSVNDLFSVKYIPTYIYYSQITPLFNDVKMRVVYSDKNMSDRLFPDMLQPRGIIKNMNGFFYHEEKPIDRETAIGLCHNLPDAVIKHSIDSCQGESVIRFSSIHGITSSQNRTVKELFDSYRKNFLVQEAVSQHERLGSLNPSSLNTIRIMTFYRDNNEVVPLFAVLRMGRKGVKVDNASAGGLYCGINEDGKLAKYAYTLKPFGKYLTSDSGVVFEGFDVPRFGDLVAKVREMHQMLPYARLIGWDMSVDENNNIVLIEINPTDTGVFQATGPAFGDYTEEILHAIRK